MARGKKYQAAKDVMSRLMADDDNRFARAASEKGVSLDQAVKTIKEQAFAKFDESVDAAINLSIDPTKSDQIVRGSVVLPHTFGKTPRVIVFAKGDYAQQARDAGADAVGDEDLIAKIEEGWLGFDFAVATPDIMGMVSRVAKILGPRGLVPNKKMGTVTFDVAPLIKDLKQGRRFFKNDKQGIVHFSFGRVSMADEQIKDNMRALVRALQVSKPPAAKGKYISKVNLSSTMGAGVRVNEDELVGVKK